MKKHINIKFISFLLLFLAAICVFAQQDPIDSLAKYVKTANTDSNKIIALNNLSRLQWQSGEIDNAIINANEALKISKKINFKKGEANAHINIGIININKGHVDKALQHFFEALKSAQKISDNDIISTCYNCLGLGHENLGDYDKALDFHHKALFLFRTLGNKNKMASSYNNIGNIYGETNKHDSAIIFFLKAAELKREIKDTLNANYANMIDNLGSEYYLRSDYINAKCFLIRAVAIRDQLGDILGMTNSNLNLSYLYVSLGKFELSKKHLQKAISLAISIDAKYLLKSAYLSHSKCDSIIGNFKEAYDYYKLYSSTKDSIFNLESIKSVAQMQEFYESDTKDTKIKLLKIDQALHKETIAKQKTITIAVITGLLLTLIFSGFIYNRFKLTQKQKIIIEKQKDEVEEQREIAEKRRILAESQKHIITEKNKEITDSIQYASRIQNAMLTAESYISKYLNAEFFILYQPKDIVSGDFYWAAFKNNNFYFATADCTGHGVPGAFMSLLNISFLNENLNEKNILEPALILNEQRKNIISSLNPIGTENSQDGMDCILCKFDITNLKLTYAAANNAPWLVRRTTYEISPQLKLTQFPSDKMPVGKYTEELKDFNQHEIDLQKGDTLYTFTDGYADQFGGPKGKKFKYKQLEDLLLSINHLPMLQQKDVLTNRINDWKANYEQIDDILIIGVRA